MEYPGYNSFHSLAYEVVSLLYRESPLTVEEIYQRFMKHGGPRVVDIDFRTRVPLEHAHLEKVLIENLEGHVALDANGWKPFGSPPPLQPIWKMYEYPWGSMGYRMGGGEDYWADWMDWYFKLDPQARARYRGEHPEPESWRHFYEYIELRAGHGDPTRKPLLDKVNAARSEYIAIELSRAAECEKEGKKEEALFHYLQAVERDGRIVEAREGYERLKTEVGWNWCD